ncbi:hypothetical protein SteCoe_5168 [Stentor coeruleus]|uniref:Uncharacterized protein n=1 Tax=Stentor coeruleus TaxID=5963 RepID=A0A1R2CT25_9CILI|nr:hypothetical protein SteCoe_5168 [Stentor coeruleus]
MLYQKQQANPRSPLTVIRNQIRNNMQNSISKTVSRSPSFSPVSNNLKCPAKDYTTYAPIRSLSKIENTKPTSATTTHAELKNKRKQLVCESNKLEEKLREMKKRVENEVRNCRAGHKKIPRSHYFLLFQKIKKVLVGSMKKTMKFGFGKIKNKGFFMQNIENHKVERCKMIFLARVFKEMRKIIMPVVEKRKGQIEMARRHYRLQLMIFYMTKWQELVYQERIRPEEKSYIEEMDSLLEDFVYESKSLILF